MRITDCRYNFGHSKTHLEVLLAGEYLRSGGGATNKHGHETDDDPSDRHDRRASNRQAILEESGDTGNDALRPGLHQHISLEFLCW
jgi:hypothetical protein